MSYIPTLKTLLTSKPVKASLRRLLKGNEAESKLCLLVMESMEDTWEGPGEASRKATRP